MTSCEGVHLGSSKVFVNFFLMSSLLPIILYVWYFSRVCWKYFQLILRNEPLPDTRERLYREFLLVLQSLLPCLNIIFWWWYSISSVFVDWYAFGWSMFFTFCPCFGFSRILLKRQIEVWFQKHLKVTERWIWLRWTSDYDPAIMDDDEPYPIRKSVVDNVDSLNAMLIFIMWHLAYLMAQIISLVLNLLRLFVFSMATLPIFYVGLLLYRLRLMCKPSVWRVWHFMYTWKSWIVAVDKFGSKKCHCKHRQVPCDEVILIDNNLLLVENAFKALSTKIEEEEKEEKDRDEKRKNTEEDKRTHKDSRECCRAKKKAYLTKDVQLKLRDQYYLLHNLKESLSNMKELMKRVIQSKSGSEKLDKAYESAENADKSLEKLFEHIAKTKIDEMSEDKYVDYCARKEGEEYPYVQLYAVDINENSIHIDRIEPLKEEEKLKQIKHEGKKIGVDFEDKEDTKRVQALQVSPELLDTANKRVKYEGPKLWKRCKVSEATTLADNLKKEMQNPLKSPTIGNLKENLLELRENLNDLKTDDNCKLWLFLHPLQKVIKFDSTKVKEVKSSVIEAEQLWTTDDVEYGSNELSLKEQSLIGQSIISSSSVDSTRFTRVKILSVKTIGKEVKKDHQWCFEFEIGCKSVYFVDAGRSTAEEILRITKKSKSIKDGIPRMSVPEGRFSRRLGQDYKKACRKETKCECVKEWIEQIDYCNDKETSDKKTSDKKTSDKETSDKSLDSGDNVKSAFLPRYHLDTVMYHQSVVDDALWGIGQIVLFWYNSQSNDAINSNVEYMSFVFISLSCFFSILTICCHIVGKAKQWNISLSCKNLIVASKSLFVKIYNTSNAWYVRWKSYFLRNNASNKSFEIVESDETNNHSFLDFEALWKLSLTIYQPQAEKSIEIFFPGLTCLLTYLTYPCKMLAICTCCSISIDLEIFRKDDVAPEVILKEDPETQIYRSDNKVDQNLRDKWKIHSKEWRKKHSNIKSNSQDDVKVILKAHFSLLTALKRCYADDDENDEEGKKGKNTGMAGRVDISLSPRDGSACGGSPLASGGGGLSSKDVVGRNKLIEVDKSDTNVSVIVDTSSSKEDAVTSGGGGLFTDDDVTTNKPIGVDIFDTKILERVDPLLSKGDDKTSGGGGLSTNVKNGINPRGTELEDRGIQMLLKTYLCTTHKIGEIKYTCDKMCTRDIIDFLVETWYLVKFEDFDDRDNPQDPDDPDDINDRLDFKVYNELYNRLEHKWNFFICYICVVGFIKNEHTITEKLKRLVKYTIAFAVYGAGSSIEGKFIAMELIEDTFKDLWDQVHMKEMQEETTQPLLMKCDSFIYPHDEEPQESNENGKSKEEQSYQRKSGSKQGGGPFNCCFQSRVIKINSEGDPEAGEEGQRMPFVAFRDLFLRNAVVEKVMRNKLELIKYIRDLYRSGYITQNSANQTNNKRNDLVDDEKENKFREETLIALQKQLIKKSKREDDSNEKLTPCTGISFCFGMAIVVVLATLLYSYLARAQEQLGFKSEM